MHAAIARVQLKKLPEMLGARRWNWLKFRELSQDLPIKLPRPNGTMSPFGFAFTVDHPFNRDTLAKQLRIKGIDCRLPTGGSFRCHVYGAPWEEFRTPTADHIHARGMFLGCPPFLAEENIAWVVGALRGAFDEQRKTVQR
jgi:dTDP-4-amino-4,6-dideoxygalactose transaminase